MIHDLGVNVAGYVKGEFGLAEIVRSNIRAIQAVNLPFVINNIGADPYNCHRYLDPSYDEQHFSQDNPYPINLINLNAEHVPLVTERLGSQYFQNRYNIGVWIWELPQFPPEWQFLFDFFDEIWTPSNHSAEPISAVSPIPVMKVSLNLDLPRPTLDRETVGFPKDKFVFLFMFDALSTFERKNPSAIVEAFIQAFGKSNPDVLLVIKFSNSQHYPQQRDQFKALIQDCPSIRLIEGHLMKEHVNALIYNCDCYISLHRAEGFGLTMAEAMFYGKPVIATGYSSNIEFMNIGNSFLVKYDLITTTEDQGPYKKGNIWANPDIAHASSLMHYVFHNYEQAQHVGLRAAYEIRSILSPSRIGQKIKSRLEYLFSKKLNSKPLFDRSNSMQSVYELQLQAWKKTAESLHLELECMRSQLNQLNHK